MLLGSGMPIAFASAAFWFVSAYWCDKVSEDAGLPGVHAVALLLGLGTLCRTLSLAPICPREPPCLQYELLKLSRRPVVYGADLSNHVMNLLPYAAVG
jgi:hypothetical protein